LKNRFIIIFLIETVTPNERKTKKLFYCISYFLVCISWCQSSELVS